MDESLSATPLRSPLALVVLALLYEAPTHPYRMHQMIKERGKDKVVNVAQRSSVQQVVHRLARDGLVEELTPEDPGGTAGSYPARVAYRITESGTRTLFGWLHDTLAHPVQEFPRFTAALAFLSLTSPATAADLLQARRATLVPTIEARAADLAASPCPGSCSSRRATRWPWPAPSSRGSTPPSSNSATEPSPGTPNTSSPPPTTYAISRWETTLTSEPARHRGNPTGRSPGPRPAPGEPPCPRHQTRNRPRFFRYSSPAPPAITNTDTPIPTMPR